jgi:hypothetical protein
LETGIVHLSWNSPGLPGGSAVKNGGMYQESLLHYDVYRNGQLLADEVCTLEYDDDLTSMPYGNYSYYVGAVYNEGIVFTQPITIEYNGTGVEAGMAGIPEHYYIEPNYPNPFNPSTNFNFGLPEGGEVSLTIYNIYGQEVERLMEGYRPAGNYRLSWNAQGLPSGIYFFRFSTAKYSNCGKMLLLK